MKLDYLKKKKELVSVILLGVSAFFAVLILVKVTGFFTAPARAEKIVKNAVQNNTDANDMDKYFAKYKALANELKKNNLFTPPPPKQHPINEVLGIFGNEVLIKDKWYKIGATVGEAKIVAIGPTKVTIEWDGKEKTFSPIDAKGSSQPGGPRGRGSRAAAKSSESKGGSAQMVTVGSAVRPMDLPKVAIEKMKERFKNMSGADRDKFMAVMKKSEEKFKKMSDVERAQFKYKMLERFSGGEAGGGKRGGK